VAISWAARTHPALLTSSENDPSEDAATWGRCCRPHQAAWPYSAVSPQSAPEPSSTASASPLRRRSRPAPADRSACAGSVSELRPDTLNLPVGLAALCGDDAICSDDIPDVPVFTLAVELGVGVHQPDGRDFKRCPSERLHLSAAVIGSSRGACVSTHRRITSATTVHLHQWRRGSASLRSARRLTKNMLTKPGAGRSARRFAPRHRARFSPRTASGRRGHQLRLRESMLGELAGVIGHDLPHYFERSLSKEH